jgi:hypothetical protein
MMAGGDAALQLLATQRCGEAGRTLQLVAMARTAVGYSLLLRQWPAALQLAARGRQRVTAYCCDNDQQRCNSRRWADSAATRGDGRQRAVALANTAL